MFSRTSVRVGVALAVVGATGVTLAMPAAGASLGNLTILGNTGSTISGSPTITASAPCTAGTDSATASVMGAGFTGSNENGSVNFIGNTPVTDAATPVTLTTGNTWDAIAIDAGAPRPLNGTATVFLNCRDVDGLTTDTFSRDITFVGSGAPSSPGTWTAAPDPTPTPVATPTPAPTPVPTPTPAPPPTQANQDIKVSVADNGQNGLGQFTMTVPSNGLITMALTPGLQGPVGSQYLKYTASLNDVRINDSRPGYPAWSVAGQMGSFAGQGAVGGTTNGGFSLPGTALGWLPSILATDLGAGAIAGPQVTPGYPLGGSGLSVQQILAYAQNGHGGASGQSDAQATLDADLTLQIPTSARPGDYQGTLTLTTLS